MFVGRFAELSESEVGDFDFAFFGDEDIFGFDIAVDDTGFSGGFESGGDLTHDVECGGEIEFTAFAKESCEVAALNVFLGDEVESVFVSDGVDLNDIGVVQAGRHHGFLAEVGEHIFAGLCHE